MHFSVTPVGELSCSHTHDRYAYSIFRCDLRYNSSVNDSFPLVLEVSLNKKATS